MQTLGVPFDESFLRFIADRTLERGWVDVADTVQWLLAHQSADAMTEAIRSAWLRSPLPVREMAHDILRVDAYVTDFDLGLIIRFRDESKSPVLQGAPLEVGVCDRLLMRWPDGITSVFRDIMLAAPAFCYADVGDTLMDASYARHPLKLFNTWLSRRQNVVLTDELDPARYAFEVAKTRLFDTYLLGVEGALYFFDHLVLRVLPYPHSVSHFVETCFSDPFDIDSLAGEDRPLV